MTAEIVDLHVSIHTIKVNNKKITPAMFAQIDEGDLAKDSGWLSPDIDDLWGNHFFKDFRILGRHSYKAEESNDTHFLYWIDNEIRKGSLSLLMEDMQERWAETFSDSINSNNILSELTDMHVDDNGFTDNEQLVVDLAKAGLMGETFVSHFSKPFYEWEPKYLPSDRLVPVTFSPIHKNMLANYSDTVHQPVGYLTSSWAGQGDSVQNRREEAEIAKIEKLIKLMVGLKEAEIPALCARWFTLNAELIREDGHVLKGLSDSYKADIELISQKVLSSPKLFIGV